MRKWVSLLLITAIAAVGTPTGLMAADHDAIELNGTVFTTNLQPLSKTEVQIRDLMSGARVNSTVSDTEGEFTFHGLRPGTYVVEVVAATGRVLGMSAPFRLGSAPKVTVSVVAVAQGLASSDARSGGFSLFGLGPVSSLAVLGAAGAAGVTAVVATRPDASPSR